MTPYIIVSILKKKKKKILPSFPSFKDVKTPPKKTPKPPNFSTNNICAKQTMNVKIKKKKKRKKKRLYFILCDFVYGANG